MSLKTLNMPPSSQHTACEKYSLYLAACWLPPVVGRAKIQKHQCGWSLGFSWQQFQKSNISSVYIGTKSGTSVSCFLPMVHSIKTISWNKHTIISLNCIVFSCCQFQLFLALYFVYPCSGFRCFFLLTHMILIIPGAEPEDLKDYTPYQKSCTE